MGKKDSDDGVAKIISGLVVGVIVIIAMVPKEVWIALGVIAGAAILIAVVVWADKEYDKRRAAKAVAAKRDREAQVQKAKQQRINTLGKANAALVESALAAVKQVGGSEAARAGWLGDVDFTADIREITDKFEKAHALRKVSSELSALNKPSLDDRKILAEAKTTTANLERAAIERVELIVKCATEARLIDESLHTEREDARTAEQRAELHGKLSAMLYGVDATRDTAPTDSAADAVMARVMAYREIKDQISRARDI
ncbi:hypothetical protein [Mycobacterium sp. RTGN5]|uniref:hypothetical protein n=1 Tax=Mycobacterium sp. RTGN5 TaxID=3016522 RepID=UPI0029C9857A|nr:hypothetical protein [Mycobacterium sp. RTGN5]